MTCWECKFIVKSGNRFVNNFECSHPENREDDVRNIVLHIEDLEEGNECEHFEPITSKEQE